MDKVDNWEEALVTKLCPRGKAAAKRKFKVYPSAYANAYASKICAGKIKDPSGVKRKDFRGPKPSKAMGGRIYKAEGGLMAFEGRKFREKQLRDKQIKDRRRAAEKNPNPKKNVRKGKFKPSRSGMMGGGMMQMPRAMYGKGGGVCKRGMGRAYGKNS